MKKYIFLCLIIIGALASCKSKNTNAIKSIISPVETAEMLVTKYDSNVLSALDNKKYNYIQVISKSALDSLNVRIYDLQNLVIDPQQEELRNAAVNYIQAMQAIISAESVYASIKDNSTDKTIELMDTKSKTAIDKTEQAYTKYKEELLKVSK